MVLTPTGQSIFKSELTRSVGHPCKSILHLGTTWRLMLGCKRIMEALFCILRGQAKLSMACRVVGIQRSRVLVNVIPLPPGTHYPDYGLCDGGEIIPNGHINI
ncbi:hypothetical protein PILCRDRAFT_343749 [Piloderma croceum F 1598]|uniref:Uncharacterized protein n=1 Tax=Piloderma croceum (strain F 1598) TaxID=765440 RepID=A0A0C3G1P0_PILCF|nr:hypothetical protein PILCRDRAFT_343749 [Piloderma croceum F 1598]